MTDSKEIQNIIVRLLSGNILKSMPHEAGKGVCVIISRLNKPRRIGNVTRRQTDKYIEMVIKSLPA